MLRMLTGPSKHCHCVRLRGGWPCEPWQPARDPTPQQDQDQVQVIRRPQEEEAREVILHRCDDDDDDDVVIYDDGVQSLL